MQLEEYDSMRAVEDSHWWYTVQRDLVSRVVAERIQSGARVLDAGCGTGGMAQRLKAWEVWGVDRAERAVELCKARGEQRVSRAEVEALPFESGSFDAVLSLDVLYHQDVDEQKAMDEMTRVLKPGGILVVNVAAHEVLKGPHDVVVCGARRYNAGQVRRMFRFHRLRTDMIHYWNAWLFLPLLLWRAVGRWRRSMRSDVRPMPRLMDDMLARVAAMDATLSRKLRLPFGSSVFAVGTKIGNEPV